MAGSFEARSGHGGREAHGGQAPLCRSNSTPCESSSARDQPQIWASTFARGGSWNSNLGVELEKYSAKERVSLSDIIDTRGPSGNSLLHVAAGIENADILRALLEVIPDKRLAAEANHRGDTGLHVAARAGRIRSAELLLGCGRIVHMANDAGNTALREAVKNGDAELTSLFLSRGSRAVYPENKESKCPLYLAVETGNLEILKLLMEAMDENEVPWSRMQGMSPVHGAVMHRQLG